jgi:hypothetical protein
VIVTLVSDGRVQIAPQPPPLGFRHEFVKLRESADPAGQVLLESAHLRIALQQE